MAAVIKYNESIEKMRGDKVRDVQGEIDVTSSETISASSLGLSYFVGLPQVSTKTCVSGRPVMCYLSGQNIRLVQDVATSANTLVFTVKGVI